MKSKDDFIQKANSVMEKLLHTEDAKHKKELYGKLMSISDTLNGINKCSSNVPYDLYYQNIE